MSDWSLRASFILFSVVLTLSRTYFCFGFLWFSMMVFWVNDKNLICWANIIGVTYLTFHSHRQIPLVCRLPGNFPNGCWGPTGGRPKLRKEGGWVSRLFLRVGSLTCRSMGRQAQSATPTCVQRRLGLPRRQAQTAPRGDVKGRSASPKAKQKRPEAAPVPKRPARRSIGEVPKFDGEG